MRTIPSIAVSITIIVLSMVYLSMNFVQAQDKSNDEFNNLKPKILESIDREQLIKEAEEREKNAEEPIPFRFAVVENNLSFTTTNSGMWEDTADGRRWRLRLKAPGALSLSLGITRFNLPEGATLQIYDVERKLSQGPYTSANRSDKGRLWTAMIERDEIIVEILVSADNENKVDIEITRVNKGFRGYSTDHMGHSGDCNINVICPKGNDWRDEIRSVAKFTFTDVDSRDADAMLLGTESLCTGTMLNNSSIHKTPYFLSTEHCTVTNVNDDTVKVYWNFEQTKCGRDEPGNILNPHYSSMSTTGVTLKAFNAASDFMLLELTGVPANIYYSGWDATNLMTPPSNTVGIHHPKGDVKAISESNVQLIGTARGDDSIFPSDGNHWRVDHWVDGTTERGSSGSCLWYKFGPPGSTTKHCIGTLFGSIDYSPPRFDCPTVDSPDYKQYWYGKFSASWDVDVIDIPPQDPIRHVHDLLDPGGTGDPIRLNGDPHIKTTKYDKEKQKDEDVHFDFQGGGEYVAFQDTDIAEIQVRMSPISTTFQPGPNPYHKLASCVSLNSAVAAQVGKHRVTYQPNLDGEPDPEGLQLRIDGELVNFDDNELDLGNGGKVIRTDDNGGILVDFPEKYSLIVTPNWWASQKAWYLNIGIKRKPVLSVSGQSANSSPGLSIGGLAAPIHPDSWLSLLSDGSSVGAMPVSLEDRYNVLYEKFGGSWRVTDATSLFDYAPGTSTGTFTMKSWPGFKGDCTIPGAITEKGLEDPDVAKEVCGQLEDKDAQADCVFDVKVTGETGFAETYLKSEQALQTLP